MRRFSAYLLLVSAVLMTQLTCQALAAPRPGGMSGGMPSVDADQASAGLLRENAESPTDASNVEMRYRKLVNIVRALIGKNGPATGILPLQEARKIEVMITNRELDQAAPLVAAAIGRLSREGRMAGPAPVASIREAVAPAQRSLETPGYSQTMRAAGTGFDADNFLWGTEVFPEHIRTSAKNVLASTLPVRYLKIRLQTNFFAPAKGGAFSPEVCMPSPANCMKRYSMDDIAGLFGENGWSMVPMISNPRGKQVSDEDMDTYVNFTDWFIARYKTTANIRYVELVDAPALWWKGTIEQLAALNNRTYDRIKGKHPDVMMGTPGFEYFQDGSRTDRSIQEIEYFLDKRNNVKFDYWAFHGYPAIEKNTYSEKKIALPPTASAEENFYAGPAGILEIRGKLDSNGWTDRLIIDTEHINVLGRPTSSVTDEEDELNAAYTTQELLIKRTLTVNGRSALAGIVTLKIAPRGDRMDFWTFSLKPDGSMTRTVRAAGLLMSKMMEYKYAAHVSGALNNDSQVWIEKFQAGNKELYVFFKPFPYTRGKHVAFDGQTIKHRFTFAKKPVALTVTGADGSVTSHTPALSVTVDAVNMPRFLEVMY